MTGQDWSASYARAVTMALSGDAGAGASPDDPFLLMLNAWWEPLEFRVPDSLRGVDWQIEVDTTKPGAAGTDVASAGVVSLAGRSLLLLRGVPSVPD